MLAPKMGALHETQPGNEYPNPYLTSDTLGSPHSRAESDILTIVEGSANYFEAENSLKTVGFPLEGSDPGSLQACRYAG